MQVLSLIERVERRDLYNLSARARVPKVGHVGDQASTKWKLLDEMAENPKEYELEKKIHANLADELVRKTKLKHTDLWVQVMIIT